MLPSQRQTAYFPLSKEKQTIEDRRERKRWKERKNERERERVECQAHTNCFYFKELSCFQTDLRKLVQKWPKNKARSQLTLTDNTHRQRERDRTHRRTLTHLQTHRHNDNIHTHIVMQLNVNSDCLLHQSTRPDLQKIISFNKHADNKGKGKKGRRRKEKSWRKGERRGGRTVKGKKEKEKKVLLFAKSCSCIGLSADLHCLLQEDKDTAGLTPTKSGIIKKYFINEIKIRTSEPLTLSVD